MQLNRSAKLVLGFMIPALIACAPLFLPSRWQHILIMWAVWTIVGMGWLVMLRVGEFSAGQVVFLAIGAYAASVLTLYFHWSFWSAWIVAGVVSAIFALAIGVFVLRLRGLYFLVITFVVAEMARLAIAATDYLGASEGMWGMPGPANIGPISFSTKQGWFYLFFFILIIACLTFWRVEKSRIGRVYMYIGTSADLAQSFGLHIMKYKVQAFVLGGFFTGLTGAAMAHYFGAISPEGFVFYYSLVAQIVAILGGIGHLVLGPLLGAFLYAGVDEYLAIIPGWRTLLMGLLLLIVIFFLPSGLLTLRGQFLGVKERKFPWYFLRRRS